MNARFEAEFEEIFKPLNAKELQTLQDFEQGERDCMNGIAHQEGKSEAYSEGYASAQVKECNQ
jgi:flagellar biosynthesis/type III secretory pathway protein FliH